LLISAFFYAPS